MTGRLNGTRVLVTSAELYMGPAIVDLFRTEGAIVTADTRDLVPAESASACVAEAGPVDVLVANLALAPRRARVQEIADADWLALFEALVHPLMRLTRAVLPQMIERQRGKIVAITSAAPLRGINGQAAYAAARGAQNAFVKSAGLEVARHNIQVNAVAQNYVENNVYYPPGLLADPVMLERMRAAIPLGRLARPEESAELALFLASDKSDFMVGQVVPFAGGWA
ncbi:MAG: SDR family oxidoreductase [Chloroflexi bacterium]|nr:SDR family oxidoreductase [Chloroflexota bacterium]